MVDFPDTSSGMIRGLRSGVSDAWLAYWTRYNTPLLRLARSKVEDVATADDIVQDVHLTMLKNVGKFRPDPDSSFRFWLRWILKKRVSDALRKRGIQAKPEELEQVCDEADEPLDEVELVHNDRYRDIRAALEHRFSKQSFEVFERSFVRKQAPAQIALELKMTVSAVEKATYRVKTAMLRLFQDDQEPQIRSLE